MFAVELDGQLTRHSEVRSPAILKYQNSQPVVDKANGVFYIVNYGKCLCFTMETGFQASAIALE
jgi:hypothetical protein